MRFTNILEKTYPFCTSHAKTLESHSLECCNLRWTVSRLKLNLFTWKNSRFGIGRLILTYYPRKDILSRGASRCEYSDCNRYYYFIFCYTLRHLLNSRKIIATESSCSCRWHGIDLGIGRIVVYKSGVGLGSMLMVANQRFHAINFVWVAVEY